MVFASLGFKDSSLNIGRGLPIYISNQIAENSYNSFVFETQTFSNSDEIEGKRNIASRLNSSLYGYSMTVMSSVDELYQPLKFNMKINGKEMPPISTFDFFQYRSETVGNPSYSAIPLNRYDNSQIGVNINSYTEKGADSFSFISMSLAQYIVDADDSYDSIDQLLGEIYEIKIGGLAYSFTINNLFDTSPDSILDNTLIHSEQIIESMFGKYCIVTNFNELYSNNQNVLFCNVSAQKDSISGMIKSLNLVSSLDKPFRTYFLGSNRTIIKDPLLEHYCINASLKPATICDGPYAIAYGIISISSVFLHFALIIISLLKHKIAKKDFVFLMLSLVALYCVSSLLLYIAFGDTLVFVLHNNIFFACLGLLIPCLAISIVSAYGKRINGNTVSL
ncbi:MAG: hypothetical protein WC366_04235 [Bacilli bacterium]|jgi:hypothetical protein